MKFGFWKTFRNLTFLLKTHDQIDSISNPKSNYFFRKYIPSRSSNFSPQKLDQTKSFVVAGVTCHMGNRQCKTYATIQSCNQSN